MEIPLHDPRLILNGFYLTHGHHEFGSEEVGGRHILMGNEHPAVVVKDDVGIKHRFKAFVSGRLSPYIVTVLPSVSPLAYRSDINEVPQRDLLSPMLKKHLLDKLTPYMIEIGVAVRRFPKLKYL